jgi:3-oxoacyl-[acyl-carrier protein] reductase
MALLKGKRVFITGGSRGIGRGLCQVFAREGATIAFNYNSNDEAAEETKRLVETEGQKCLVYKVSVTDKHGMKAVAKEIEEKLGGIDVLVNNAAVNKADNFLTTTEKSWHDIVDTNVHGLYYVTKPFYKMMSKARAGNILNITSIAAVRSLPTSVHYATAKAAVVGFTKCLAREAGNFGVSVNAIAAGIYDTDLGNSLPDAFKLMYENWCIQKRFGQPEDLAEFAAFLVSDRNRYMTGEVVIVDGGSIV